MLLGFLLTKDAIALAREEVLAVLATQECIQDAHFLLVEVEEKKISPFFFKRLAYTRIISRVLFSSENLLEDIASFEWNVVCLDTYAVRIRQLDKTSPLPQGEGTIVDTLWRRLKKAKVCLDSPATRIEFVHGKKWYACLVLCDVEKGYLSRKPHLRPSLHPSSLHPKIARALVNLTGAEKGSLIIDPFCGSGGILIEAGLLGMKTEGHDINKKMLLSCQKNLDHYKIKRYALNQGDGTAIEKRYEYIVTDFPYGKSTQLSEKRETLYLSFLQNLEKNLLKRAVVVFPSFVDHAALIAKTALQQKKEFTLYVHASLSRTIVILEKKS